MKFAYASGTRPLEGYTLKRGIGIGGFGEVYFAISDAGKEVALKRIQRNLDVELRGVSQCLNLKHINLIALWDIKYDDEGEGWVVMEYVAGESLKDVVDRNPNGMPMDEVHHWFKGIAAGVAYLHDHGIVHRDLKPGNIFVDEDVVKIGDYGLSKFISCSRRSGQTESVGTFHYMAPEIGKGVYGKEIDIYALGIILFEMMTGRVPFEGESSQEIMMKHLTADPELSDISEPYRSVILKAMAKDPDLRYANVPDMLNDLPIDGRRIKRPEEILTARERVASADSASVQQDSIPPVRPLVIGPDESDTLFIRDEPDEIHLGDVRDVVTAQPATNPQQRPAGERSRTSNPRNGSSRSTTAYNRRGADAASQPRTQTRRQNTKEMLREYLRSKPQIERLTELTGSLLFSAGVCAVLCLVMMILGAGMSDADQWWTGFTWLTLTSIAGAWLVLGIGKFWESSKGDHIQRRFVMLVAGLILGVLAGFVSDHLRVEWSNRAPNLPIFLTFFGALFVVLRWWKQADPVRGSRMSITSLLISILTSIILAAILQFPIPFAIVLAVAISVAVQISSSWISPNDRIEVRRQYQEA